MRDANVGRPATVSNSAAVADLQAQFDAYYANQEIAAQAGTGPVTRALSYEQILHRMRRLPRRPGPGGFTYSAADNARYRQLLALLRKRKTPGRITALRRLVWDIHAGHETPREEIYSASPHRLIEMARACVEHLIVEFGGEPEPEPVLVLLPQIEDAVADRREAIRIGRVDEVRGPPRPARADRRGARP